MALLSGFVGVSRLRSDTTLEWYLICMRDKQAVLPADDVVFSLASSEKNSNSQGRENVVAVSIGSDENATCSTLPSPAILNHALCPTYSRYVAHIPGIGTTQFYTFLLQKLIIIVDRKNSSALDYEYKFERTVHLPLFAVY